MPHASIYATEGVHPHESRERPRPRPTSAWRSWSRHPKVTSVRARSDRDYHLRLLSTRRAAGPLSFRTNADFAADAGKPIVIHTREAWDDTAGSDSRNIGSLPGLGGIMHCFSGGPKEAMRSLALGFHLSFRRPTSRSPKALDVQEAARQRFLPTRIPDLEDRRALPGYPSPRRGKRKWQREGKKKEGVRTNPPSSSRTARKLAETARGIAAPATRPRSRQPNFGSSKPARDARVQARSAWTRLPLGRQPRQISWVAPARDVGLINGENLFRRRLVGGSRKSMPTTVMTQRCS
jgi:hypothetical protein